MYDYGWRNYMPDIARWNGMDQLSEKFHVASPYAYVMNNPAMMYDPDGRDMAPWMSALWGATKEGQNITFGGFSSDGTPSWMNSSSSSSQYSSFGDFSPGSTGIGFSQGANGGSSINDNLSTIDIPEVFLTAKSSDWGQQIQDKFNAFMEQFNTDNAKAFNFWMNTAVGAASTGNIQRSGFLKYNNLWHHTKLEVFLMHLKVNGKTREPNIGEGNR